MYWFRTDDAVSDRASLYSVKDMAGSCPCSNWCYQQQHEIEDQMEESERKALIESHSKRIKHSIDDTLEFDLSITV